MKTLNGYCEIVSLLTTRVRVLSDEQVARCRNIPPSTARRGLRRLADEGFISFEPFLVHPPLSLTEPLLDWHPDAPSAMPNFDSIAWKAQSRWNKPPVRTLLAKATKAGRRLTGGLLGGRPIRPLEASHDLTLTEWFLSLDESLKDAWTPEDALPVTPGTKNPDGVLRFPCGTTVFVELAGKAYSGRRIRAIHEAFKNHHYRIY